MSKNRRLRRTRSFRKGAHPNAKPAWYGEFDQLVLAEAYDLAQRRERATGFPWHVDHMIPIKSKIACGLHCGANIQVIPGVINSAKGNKMVLTQPGEWIGYLEGAVPYFPDDIPPVWGIAHYQMPAHPAPRTMTTPQSSPPLRPSSAKGLPKKGGKLSNFDLLLMTLEEANEEANRQKPGEPTISRQPHQETPPVPDPVLAGLTMARQAISKDDDARLADIIDAAIHCRQMSAALARVRVTV